MREEGITLQNRTKSDHCIGDVWKAYNKEHKDDAFAVDRTVFIKVNELFNKKVMNNILYKSDTFNAYCRLGHLKIIKTKMDMTKSRKTGIGLINWKASRELHKKILHLNDHTSNNIYSFYWDMFPSNVLHKGFYKFQPSRTNKRHIAKILNDKELCIDYFLK